MKIGIFGGSFNPVHNGHINIAKEAIAKLKLDKLIFVPTFISPFKTKFKQLDAQDRIAMLKLVLVDKSEVSSFEVNRKGTSYTIDTVRYFKQKFPKDELFLIIGTDHLSKLNKWKNIREISNTLKIVALKRDKKFSKINIKKFNILLLNNSLQRESSKDIRKGDLSQIDPKVLKYIAKQRLLLLEIGQTNLSARRHKHCIAAASFAAQLAKNNKMDVEQAWVAGLMHDITKEWTDEEHKEFLISKGFDPSGSPSLIWHQWTGAIWLDEVYGLKDKEVKQAIFRHSNADAISFDKLSQLDKVVYIADKLCEGRKYKGIQSHRAIALKNLDKGFKVAAEESIAFIKEKYGSINYFKLKKVNKQ